MKVKQESEKFGLKLNIQKNKILASDPINSWQIDGETVTDFILGRSKITADGDCSHEIKRRLLLGRKIMTILTPKVRLVKAMVFPAVMYGWESWTIKKAECWRIDDFELWCWRRLLRVPWTARRSNQSMLKEISPEYSFMSLSKLWELAMDRRPGMLQFMQAVSHDWETELNWTEQTSSP